LTSNFNIAIIKKALQAHSIRCVVANNKAQSLKTFLFFICASHSDNLFTHVSTYSASIVTDFTQYYTILTSSLASRLADSRLPDRPHDRLLKFFKIYTNRYTIKRRRFKWLSSENNRLKL